MDRNRGLDINALRQQLEDLIEDFFPGGGSRRQSGGRGDQAQHLQVNLVETEDSYVLTAPLPGFQPDDIEINVRGQNLSLRAQRKNQSGDRPNYIRREWGSTPFHRSVELPGPVDADNAAASFKQGIVTITLPKGERPKSIPVDESEGGDPAEAAAPETEAETPDTEPPTEAQPETTPEAPEAEADAESEAQPESGRGGRSSFYMRPTQGGRRGRSGRGGSQPKAQSEAKGRKGEAPETPEPADDAKDAVPKSADDGPEAREADAHIEPAADDASPVAHTTTASDEVSDLSDQRGPSTEEADKPDTSGEDKANRNEDAEPKAPPAEPTD